MKSFVINNKSYLAKEFTFGTIRQFENAGLSLSNIQSMPMTLVSVYLSICAGISVDAADKEINDHVINGGSLDEIFALITEEMAESRFFQALNKRTDQTTDETLETSSEEAATE